MNDYRHFHYNLRLSDHLIICFLWEPTLEQHFEIIFVYFFFAFYWTNKANNCHSKWIIYFPPPHHHFLLLPSLFSLGQLRNHFFQLLLHLRLGGQLLLLLLSTHKPFYSNPIKSNPIQSNQIKSLLLQRFSLLHLLFQKSNLTQLLSQTLLHLLQIIYSISL